MKRLMKAPSRYLAHSDSPSGREDLLCAHLEDVAVRAAEYAEVFDCGDEARLAGLLHDLGKYGHLFQRRLEGKESGIDHWSAGAWAALTRYRHNGIGAALAMQGHHVGLQKADKDSLRELDPRKLIQCHPQGLRLSESNVDILMQQMTVEGLELPDLSTSIYDHRNLTHMSAAAMLDVRMLFSALVDADFIETEAHFQAKPDGSRSYREPGLPLESQRALSILLSYLRELAANSEASHGVNQLRANLLEACLEAADSPQGLFTLTAPTGTGKTLAMLAFALKHAKEHQLRRIVMVIPYLSIIEQTIREYRKVFAPHVGCDLVERYILEHHSLAGTRVEDERKDGPEADVDDRVRLLAENWDAPIIVTTSVQFLESLFASRPSACRKLHRLAKSVILFDEVQTLPTRLIVPTLATLSRLAERYRGTVVFATATQPAFRRLDAATRKYCVHGWKANEIVAPHLDLFDRARRTQVEWPEVDQKTPWVHLADRLSHSDQALCVVNLKRHALSLYEEVKKRTVAGLFHLSTNMCPAHRQSVLEEVRDRLDRGEPCHLISTQCVEAGVDVDFPTVCRAFGPLDAIAQAAGRCNRNGIAEIGRVHVFIPEDECYPDGTYRQAADVTRLLLRQYGPGGMDIHDTGIFEAYYRELYDLTKPERLNKDLLQAIEAMDFVDVARQYRVIEKNAINVLVPYDREIFQQLAAEVRESGLTRRWIARVRPYTVGLFKPQPHDPVQSHLEPVFIRRNVGSEEWFIYLSEEHYDSEKGLIPPSQTECLIA